jgi:hypothetical protein
MSNQDNNNNNNNNNTSSGTFDQIMKELIENENDKKREREEDDDDSREPESKRRKVNYTYDESNYVPSESPYEYDSEDSDVVSDSASDNGEQSEVARINTKFSKRFDAIEDYKEKNELLSENVIQDVMNKVDSGETLSRQDFDTLDRADRLMDRDVYNDKTLAEDMILYENSSNIVQKEINENMDRIAHHQRKLDNYLSRLIELNQENSKMSSNNDSSSSDNNSNNNNYDSNNSSNSPDSNGEYNNPSSSPGPNDNSNNPDSNNSNPDSNNPDSDNSNPDSNNPSNSPGLNDGADGGDDDGFDDFPPSFDFDDF